MEGVRNYSARNPDIDAMEEDMEIPDKPEKILGMFGFPVARLPCDLKGAADNTNESSINQIEDYGNMEVVSDEGDCKDGMSSIITSRVGTVVDDQDYVVLCKPKAKTTSPISSTLFVEVEDGANTETAMDFDNSEYHNESEGSLSTEAQKSCNFCSYTTNRDDRLKKHRQLHTVKNEPIVSCIQCDYKAPRISLFYHYKYVHESQNDNNPGRNRIHKRTIQTQYTCRFCSFTTPAKCNLRRHTRLHTVYNRPTYHCPTCDYKSTMEMFLKHVKISHKIDSKNISSLAKTKRLKKCDFCSYTTEYNHRLKMHSLVHIVANKPIISCTECDYKAPRFTLFQHYKNVHGSQKVKTEYTSCKFCSYTTHNKSTLRDHIRLHTVHNRPVYRCLNCDYKSTKINITNHVKIVHKIQSIDSSSVEKSEQVYTCEFCAYTTKFQDYFEKHLLVHSVSSSSLVGQETDLETLKDLVKCENHIVLLFPKCEREGEESDKENSTAATLPVSFCSLVGQEANTSTALDLVSSKSHNVSSLIKDEEDEQVDKGNSTAVTSPTSSTSLAGHEPDMKPVVDSDIGENSSVSPISNDNEEEEVDRANSTPATLSISTKSLVGDGAGTETNAHGFG